MNVRPRKDRGQNFLIEEEFVSAIVDFGAAQPGETLIEIGPGLGALTELLSKYPNLSVIEIEEEFCADLRRRFPQITVIEEDVRAVDFGTLGKDLVVFGNLPYALSTEIIFHLVANAQHIKRAVLMLQREFAERLGAKPHTRDYGTISVAVQLWADITLGKVIPGTAFHPRANVDSRLIKLSFLKEPRYPIGDPLWFQRVVRAAFVQRRKKLHNSLKSSMLVQVGKVDQALAASGIDGNRRAETLTIEEFTILAKALREE